MTKLTLVGDFPEISESDWISQAEATIRSGGIERLVSKTNDGIAIQPIYQTPDDAFPALNTSAAQWKIVQRTDIPDIAAANGQILDDLLNGATGISLVLPGSVTAGSCGVPVQSVADIKRLMKDVELDLISLRLDAGRLDIEQGGWQAAHDLLQVYQDRNLDLSRCDLTLALDPVASFAITGASVGVDELVSQMVGVLDHARESGHNGVVFCGDGRLYHESGASQAQELGFALASTVQHLRLLELGGVDLAGIWPQLGLVLSADADQFLTIAKLRAGHLIWQQLQEAMGVTPSRLALDVETSLAMMSRRGPYVNMLRTTTAAFAAGIGGAGSISVLPFTSAIGVPDGFARRMARNAQIVLQEESSIGMVGDAAAGSGYVEAVTGQIAENAWSIMQDIEASGGMLNALANGQVQQLIAESSAKTAAAVGKRKQAIIGVSEFASLEETPVKVLDFKPVESPATSVGDLNCDRLTPVSISQPFETLRDQAETMNNPPVVQLVTLGGQADFAARATWISNLFAAGGIGVSNETKTSKIACICSTDAVYGEQAAAIAAQLKSDGVELVYIAGRPKDLVDSLKDAGVDDFVYAGCDVLALLQNTLKRLAD